MNTLQEQLEKDAGLLHAVEDNLVLHGLSQHGIVPRSQEERQAIIKIANALYLDSLQHKQQATTQDSPYVKAAAELESILGTGPSQQSLQFAAVGSADPDLFGAMVRLKAAQAQAAFEQLQAQGG